jgi:hypothetical protein
MALSIWLPLSPGAVLVILVAMTCAAALVEKVSKSRRRSHLRELAVRWQMTYSPHDRLRVTPKITHHLPVPGAADLYVTDVIYGVQGGQYRYVFTVEYTIGVVRGKRRQVRVATFCESRNRDCNEPVGSVVFAPEDLSLVEQYEKLAPGEVATKNSTS